jgi:hypothetical protein
LLQLRLVERNRSIVITVQEGVFRIGRFMCADHTASSRHGTVVPKADYKHDGDCKASTNAGNGHIALEIFMRMRIRGTH